jgi:rhodanese-related sulfurtransferase
LDRSKTYITHCASGYRARIAWSYLHSLGYRVKAFPYPFATICNSGKAKKVTI